MKSKKKKKKGFQNTTDTLKVSVYCQSLATQTTESTFNLRTWKKILRECLL